MAQEQKEFGFIDRIRYAFGSRDTRIEIAKMKSIPESFLERIVKDKDRGVRKTAIINHSNLSEDEIRILAYDKNTDYRQSIAGRFILSEDVIRILANDEDENVRKTIAERFVLSENVIRILANDEDSEVREIIAKRPDLPEDLVRTLAKDENWWVRSTIAKRPDLPEDLIRTLAKNESDLSREVIAMRPDLPEDVIRILANDEDSEVREIIAKRFDLPEDLVRTLAKDESWDVRKTITARHSLCYNMIDLSFYTEKQKQSIKEEVLPHLKSYGIPDKNIKELIETGTTHLEGLINVREKRAYDTDVPQKPVNIRLEYHGWAVNAIDPATGKNLGALEQFAASPNRRTDLSGEKKKMEQELKQNQKPGNGKKI